MNMTLLMVDVPVPVRNLARVQQHSLLIIPNVAETYGYFKMFSKMQLCNVSTEILFEACVIPDCFTCFHIKWAMHNPPQPSRLNSAVLNEVVQRAQKYQSRQRLCRNAVCNVCGFRMFHKLSHHIMCVAQTATNSEVDQWCVTWACTSY